MLLIGGCSGWFSDPPATPAPPPGLTRPGDPDDPTRLIATRVARDLAIATGGEVTDLRARLDAVKAEVAVLRAEKPDLSALTPEARAEQLAERVLRLRAAQAELDAIGAALDAEGERLTAGRERVATLRALRAEIDALAAPGLDPAARSARARLLERRLDELPPLPAP